MLRFEPGRAYFDPKFFGEKVLKGQPGQETEIDAIFDNESIIMDDNYGPVNTPQPQLTCNSDDVPEVVEGSRFVVRGVFYRALKPVPDGTGVTTIRLMRL